MGLSSSQIAEQKKQAEELLFAGPPSTGFAKQLFFGRFHAADVFPYPELAGADRERVEEARRKVRAFADEHIDAPEIDRQADIPKSVISGLADLGVLGMTAPAEFGGKGFSQLAYTRIMEIIGGHCASTAVFVNAHHSIGIRALLLFGTEEQKRRWLPDLVAGRKLAAFALTEPAAGSDASNVQTQAVPSPDGKTWFLTGEKRYITNGAIAQVLTVMARTPVPGSTETKVTAFLVTPDMPGFEIVEARMPKCGIRSTATARLAFRNMPVPAENVLGPVGKGLRVALTVLDFGRTTFGASCTGAAKFCLEASVRHANRRVQFQQPIGDFELIKKKIAFAAAHAFAMEALTAQCAGFIDRGAEDYMLETAMLKVFSTEHLWTIANDTLQIHGGQGYFSNEPYERIVRDARINLIGEGANEVLKSFIAVVGMRDVAERLRGVQAAIKRPWAQLGNLMAFGKEQVANRMRTPTIPVQTPTLKGPAKRLARILRDFGLAVQNLLFEIRWRAGSSEELKIAEVFLKSQYQHERIADVACDLYASSCVMARLDALAAGAAPTPAGVDGSARSTLANGAAAATSQDGDWPAASLFESGLYFLDLAGRRMKANLAALRDNDDASTTKLADSFLRAKK